MANKKFVIPSLVSIVSVGLVGIFASTMAWLSTKTSIATVDKLDGSSDGAYFAYGNGDKQDDETTADFEEGPYGIETARQLYNLAWLQYLGYFNKIDEETGVYKQYYFELNADIDMTGWVLPPIGTTANPFIGVFDGQGHTISNLVTSNNFTDITNSKKMPSKVRANTSTYVTDNILNDCNIIGMFGVVGALDEDATDETLKYNSSIISLTNYDISGASIKNATSAVLIGVAAGYVNGAMSDVGVVSSSVTSNGATSLVSTYSKFTDVSSYSVVGYCAKEYIGNINGSTVDAYNAVYSNEEYIAQDAGEESGWGGSIDMKTMYNGILGPWQSYSNSADGIPEYPTTATATYDENGQLVGEINYSDYTDIPDQSNVWSSGSYTNLRYYQYEQKDGDYVTSSYTFASRHNSSGTTLDNYLYLYGDTTNLVSNGMDITNTYQDPTVYISKTIENDATYYFRYNSGIAYTTESAYATELVDADGILYFTSGSTKYYLYQNGTSLATTTYSDYASVFDYDADNESYYVEDEGTSYYLSFDNSSYSWVFVTDTVSKYIHSGTNYLTVGSQYYSYYYYTGNTTSGNAPSWTMPNNGYSGTISCEIDSTTYYLYYSSYYGLMLSSYYSTEWDVNDDGTTISYDDYYLIYDSEWTVEQPVARGYKIQDGSSHYLSVSGTSITSTDSASATTWYTTTVSGNTTYYTKIGNQNYYIVYSSSSPYFTLSTNSSGCYYLHNGGLYYKISNKNRYYITYSSGWTYATKSKSLTFEGVYEDAGTIEITVETTECDKTTTVSDTGNYVERTETTTQDASYTTKPTYFPLRQEETDSTPNGIPKDTNTGYVISGANDTTGDIRVSYYNQSKLSYGLDRIYSRDDDGDFFVYNTNTGVDLSDEYETLESSRTSLQTVFDDDANSYVYGLHFVGATIAYGTNQSVYAGKAIINGETYYDYELPKDCIDFNLKEKGYINFLAGTYFSGEDNCFFSLHDIFRNSSNGIATIKEISEIYGSTVEANSYVYKYSDGTYSVAYKYKDGEKVLVSNEAVSYEEGMTTTDLPNDDSYSSTPIFKTSWIKQNTLSQYYAYFFEIPMNDGEYCLSSVASTNGAYLMYLDIGANAKKVNRSQIIEKFYELQSVFSYPKGVGIILAAGNTVSDTNSYCVCLDSGYNGTLALSKVQNGDVEEGRYTGSGDDTGESSLSYKSPSLIVRTEDDGELKEASPTSYTEITTTRLTFYDYGVTDDQLTKIIVTDVNTIVHNSDGTTNETTTRTIKKYKNVVINADGTETMEEDDTLPIYIWYTISGQQVIIDCTNTTKYSQGTDLITYTTSENTTKILSFTTTFPDGSSLAVSFTLAVTASQESAGHYIYTPSGYTVTITLTDTAGSETDITAECQITYVLNNDGTYTYTITVNGTSASGSGDLDTVITITVSETAA